MCVSLLSPTSPINVKFYICSISIHYESIIFNNDKPIPSYGTITTSGHYLLSVYSSGSLLFAIIHHHRHSRVLYSVYYQRQHVVVLVFLYGKSNHTGIVLPNRDRVVVVVGRATFSTPQTEGTITFSRVFPIKCVCDHSRRCR